MNKITIHANQSGAALITSMLILLVMTIIAISSMGSSTLEEKISSNYKSHKQAFFNAEEGLLEAINKLSGYDASVTPTPPVKPSTVTTKTVKGKIVYSFTVKNKPDATTPTAKAKPGTVTWDDSAATGTYAFNLKNTPYSNLENYVYKITSTGKSNNSQYVIEAEVSRSSYFRIPASLYALYETHVGDPKDPKDTSTIQGRDVCAQPNWPPPPPAGTNPKGLPSVAFNGGSGNLVNDNPGFTTIEGVIVFNGKPKKKVGTASAISSGTLAINSYISRLSSKSSAKIFTLSGSSPKADDKNFDKPYNTTTALPPPAPPPPGKVKKPGDCDDTNTVNASSPGKLSSTNAKDGTTNNIIVINISPGATLKLDDFKGCGTLIVKGGGTGTLQIEGDSQWNGLILTTERILFKDNTTILGSVISSFDDNNLSNQTPPIDRYHRLLNKTNISFCQAALDPILKDYLPPMEIISWRGNNL